MADARRFKISKNGSSKEIRQFENLMTDFREFSDEQQQAIINVFRSKGMKNVAADLERAAKTTGFWLDIMGKTLKGLANDFANDMRESAAWHRQHNREIKEKVGEKVQDAEEKAREFAAALAETGRQCLGKGNLKDIRKERIDKVFE